MKTTVDIGGRGVTVDLSSPVSLALELDFGSAQPQHFGAPPATSRPFVSPGFNGSVATGASCNCNVITVIPHCNGTHTECAGHLTREPYDAYRVVPTDLIPALVVSVEPVAANDASAGTESTDPTPQKTDTLITRYALERHWRTGLPFAPRALIVRTGYKAVPGTSAAYLTREAATLLVERSIDHLVIDLPSIDRDHDQGRLTAHRTFFGLPPASHSLADATRRSATITELAHVPPGVSAGPCLLAIQVPAWRGDAVPSRPLLYSLIQP